MLLVLRSPIILGYNLVGQVHCLRWADIPGLTPSSPSPVRAQLKSSGYWGGVREARGDQPQCLS